MGIKLGALRRQLPIQQGVFRILLSDHLQNGLQVMEVCFGKQGLHHQYKKEDRGCWHAKRGDGKGNSRAEKAICLSSGQNESETRICLKALIRRADGDSMFSAANMICFFCREVRVQNYLQFLEGTVFRFTGHVDGSGNVLEILATTWGLQSQKEFGSYQKLWNCIG